MANLISYAKRYRELGLNPIPVEAGGKRPLVAWKKYQSTAPTDSEISEWFKDDNINIAVVLGRGIFAVDLDGENAGDLLREKSIVFPLGAPLSKTGKGQHILFRSEEPINDAVGVIKNGSNQVDIRGVGYIVVPPSIHENGKKYEWILAPTNNIPYAPKELLALLKTADGPEVRLNSPGWVKEALAGVSEGLRDDVCAKLAGYFLGKKVDSDTVKLILTEIYASRCKPPFPKDQVIKTVDSISIKEAVAGEGRQIVPVSIKDVAHDFYEALFSKPTRPVSTSFEKLDFYLCGGFSPGDLVYLGARPGVGKTAMALQIAVSAAKSAAKVLIISREMVNNALFRRMVAQEGRIDAGSLRKRTESDESLSSTLEKLSNLPIWMTDQVVSIQELSVMIAEMPEIPNLLIVDHLQLMRDSAGFRDKRAQVEAVSAGLKSLALGIKLAVLCMSTLSRPFDKKDTRPTLSSLRESGELEHDADIVLLLHREFGALDADCIVAKNRDGHVGEARLKFEPQYLLFSKLDEAPIGTDTASLQYKDD